MKPFKIVTINKDNNTTEYFFENEEDVKYQFISTITDIALYNEKIYDIVVKGNSLRDDTIRCYKEDGEGLEHDENELQNQILESFDNHFYLIKAEFNSYLFKQDKIINWD
jgi:hypothetical protein